MGERRGGEPCGVDRELTRAYTLPARFYTDPAIFALESERIFRRSWQYAAPLAALIDPGQQVAVPIAGAPVVLVRGENGALRGFFNVCRHRAGEVACGTVTRKTLQCRYHGWTYDLEGRLLRTPEMDGVEEFDPAAHALLPVRADAWGPFAFASLSLDGPGLAEVLGEIAVETERLPLARMSFYRRHEWVLACNWKVYVDNYLEGYHIPIAHPALFQEIDYARYEVSTRRWHSRQQVPARARPGSLYARRLEEGRDAQALYYWVFPNLMINVYPDNVQLNVIIPEGRDRTRTVFLWFFLDVPERDPEELAGEFARSFAFSDEVQREDIELCEAVQRGLASGAYSCGRFSPRRENGVHHFHRLVAEALGAHA